MKFKKNKDILPRGAKKKREREREREREGELEGGRETERERQRERDREVSKGWRPNINSSGRSFSSCRFI